MIKKICILGGGNIGTQFACSFAAKGYEVTIHSSRPEAFGKILEMTDGEKNILLKAEIKKVTASYQEALDGCDVVFITYPAFMLSEIAEKILPYIKKGLYIGMIPGTGGAEFAFRKCIAKGAVLFGLQRVPGVARLTEYGRTVQVEGLREKLFAACIPNQCDSEIPALLEKGFGIPCEMLPNYLCITMTPSNPILHTTRLCTLFFDYTPGKIYDTCPLFYGDWNDASSALLLACDEEHQEILKHLPELDLSGVLSLKKHYESETITQMTKKISSIKSLHNLRTPMIQKNNGWIPDFSSRYFTADFPFGLAIIEQFADITGVPCCNIRKTMEWYRKMTGDNHTLQLADYGLHSCDDVYKFY